MTHSSIDAGRASLRSLAAVAFGGGRTQDLLLAALAVAVISLMVLPLPPAMLDALIAINIGLAVLLLMVAMYVPSPLALSTFPTLLLFTTLLRLSLNIASTRAILLHADAGDIIETFGRMVVGGNVVVGVVVFAIIAIVQFIVIAKGAERVAEVGARFTLDALPGKQLSIDAELRAGLIDRDESRRRRAELQRESQLYGAMDGAMKFVKGDAIAGLLIALVNILAGVSIGVAMLSMSFADSVMTYSILTVGDGLVSQIPSLFVSLAAGVLITRVSSADGTPAERSLGNEIAAQITALPKPLYVTAAVLALFMLVPGFPKLQFLGWAVAIGGGAWFLQRARARRAVFDPMRGRHLHREGLGRRRSAADIGQELVASYPVALHVPGRLRTAVESGALDERIGEVRRAVTHRLGVPFPGVVIVLLDRETDAVVFVNEIPAGTRPLEPGRELELTGQLLAGVLARHAHEFIGLQEAKYLLAESERAFPDLVAEAARLVPLARLTDVLRRLVEEGVALRNMRDILQALVEWSPKEKDPVLLTEQVRVALARQISHRYAPAGTLHAITLDGATEDAIRAAIKVSPAGNYLALDPAAGDALASRITTIASDGAAQYPVVLVSMDIRRYVKKLVEPLAPALVVLSYQELASEVRVQALGRAAAGVPVLPGDAASRNETTAGRP